MGFDANALSVASFSEMFSKRGSGGTNCGSVSGGQPSMSSSAIANSFTLVVAIYSVLRASTRSSSWLDESHDHKEESNDTQQEPEDAGRVIGGMASLA
jgi:hypothetical protein